MNIYVIKNSTEDKNQKMDVVPIAAYLHRKSNNLARTTKLLYYAQLSHYHITGQPIFTNQMTITRWGIAIPDLLKDWDNIGDVNQELTTPVRAFIDRIEAFFRFKFCSEYGDDLQEAVKDIKNGGIPETVANRFVLTDGVIIDFPVTRFGDYGVEKELMDKLRRDINAEREEGQKKSSSSTNSAKHEN